MYEWTDEQKETLFDEPKLKSNSEYPDWLWTDDFLTNLNDLDINDLVPNSEEYWKKVFIRVQSHARDIYFLILV